MGAGEAPEGVELHRVDIRKRGAEELFRRMIPEAVISMLACARIGAVHSVVFGGFAAAELAVRIDDATPKAILAGSCGIEIEKIIDYKPLLDDAIAIAKHSPDFCVILQHSLSPVFFTECMIFCYKYKKK